jgi:hypothetical protein
MPHRPNHRSTFGNRFPEYGSLGFGSAVSDRLRRQTLPRSQGLLAPNDIDVSQYIIDQGPPPPPITAPMESGVSPRQSGFTGSVEWDVMDGKLEDPLGGPDMGEDPSNVGDVVGAVATNLGQWVGDTFGPQNYPAIGSIGFPDERDQRLRQTWRRV